MLMTLTCGPRPRHGSDVGELQMRAGAIDDLEGAAEASVEAGPRRHQRQRQHGQPPGDSVAGVDSEEACMQVRQQA